MTVKPFITLFAIFLFSIIASTCAEASPPAQPDSKSTSADFNNHWRFILADDAAFKSADYDDSQWRSLSLPHDWSIEDRPGTQSPFSADASDAYDTGYAKGGVGWYRKPLPAIEKNKQYILEFDGVYMNATLFVNGKQAAQHYYGYTGFQVDITPFLHAGDGNSIAMRVHNNEQNSRWYSGSGIYRQVTLHTVPANHIKRWGTAIITQGKNKDGSASLTISTPLSLHKNEQSSDWRLEQIISQDGNIVSRADYSISGGVQQHSIDLAKPKWWQPGSPTLYTLTQRLIKNNEVVDAFDTSFGIRTLRFTADRGFLLNGQPTLLKGMNIHHDNYLLGAGAFPHAERRKVKMILAAGYNAVRSAHNPPSSAFLQAADELGLLVISESFDAWNKRKWDNKNDYSSVFKQNWQQDLADFIDRDINHPSIIMWSLGNEIPEQAEPLGENTASALAQFVRQRDSSRPVTVGANMSGETATTFLSAFDVTGYNYQPDNYVSDFQAGISSVMYGSETYSRDAFEYWQLVEKYPYVIGDFVWTGWDYIGEASIGWTGYAPEWAGLAAYPWTLAYSGEMDVLGHMRPAAYYRQVLWHTGKHRISAFVTSPTPSLSPVPDPTWIDYWTYADIHPSWSWPGYEGAPLQVTVFSDFPSVELWLNNERVGQAATGEAQQFTAQFSVNYEPGTLIAKGIDENGNVQATWQLTTASQPANIAITRESQSFVADGKDIHYLPISLQDSKGNPVYNWQDDTTLKVTVDGAAKLIALGNANPHSVESFQQSSRTTFRGQLVAVVQSNGKAGEVKVTVTGKGLRPAELTFKTGNADNN